MLLGGIALFIAGGLTVATLHVHGFPPLIGAGIGLLFIGIFFLTFGQIIVQSRRANRMRKAIAEESAKYSMRSPTPCSWRLHSTRVWTGGRNRRAAVIYRVSEI